jgi:CRP-like cAMP-binding protein
MSLSAPEAAPDSLEETSRMVHLAYEELASRAGTTLCPDCPMARVDVLASMIPPRAAVCAFRCLAVRARAPVPPRWFREFGMGIVRRGIIVRQRVDAHGRAIAVDIAGAGGLVPLAMAIGGEDANASGYAIGDVLLCACTTDVMRASMDAERQTPRDVLHLHAQALDRMERLTDARGRMTVVERVAAMLLVLADHLTPLRPTEVVTADVQQTDLAALVSARQETVCRAMCALERRGLIARNVDGVRIVDRARLEAV